MLPEAGEVTVLLRAWRNGDAEAFDSLVPMVYRELHNIAVHHMKAENSEHTLSPTALLHEAFIRLVQSQANPDWQDRKHFFVIAAKAMRRLLIDHARRKHAARRDPQNADPDDLLVATPASNPWNVIDLDRALTRLASLEPRRAKMLELRHFGGLDMAEIADATGVSRATVSREVRVAEAWLAREIRASEQT